MRATKLALRCFLGTWMPLLILLAVSMPAIAQRGHGGHDHGGSGHGGSDGHHRGSHHDSGPRGHGYHGHGFHGYGSFGFGARFGNGYGYYGRYGYGNSYDWGRYDYGYGNAGRHRSGRYAYHPGYDHLRYSRRDDSFRAPYLYGDRYGAFNLFGDFGYGRADLFWASQPSSSDSQEPYYAGLYTPEDFATQPYIWVGDIRVRNLAYQGESQPGEASLQPPGNLGDTGEYQVEPYDFRPQPALVKFSIQPADASIYLDGEFMGLASDLPEVMLLAPGEHRLEVVRPGMTSRELTFATQSGEEAHVEARLEASVSGENR